MNKYIGLSEQFLYELGNRPKRQIGRFDKEEAEKDWAEFRKIVVKFKHLRANKARRDSLCQQQQK